MGGSGDDSDDVSERSPWVSRAVLEAVGVALCIAMIGGVTSLFHLYNQQEAIVEDLHELRDETQRQWAQVFQLRDSIYAARLDLYRMIYERGESDTIRRYRPDREVHKPER